MKSVQKHALSTDALSTLDGDFNIPKDQASRIQLLAGLELYLRMGASLMPGQQTLRQIAQARVAAINAYDEVLRRKVA